MPEIKKTVYLTYIGRDSYSRYVYRDNSTGTLWKHTDCLSPRNVCQKRGDTLYSSCLNAFDGEPDVPMSSDVECVYTGIDMENIYDWKERAVCLKQLAEDQAEQARELAKEAESNEYKALTTILKGLGFENKRVFCKKTNKIGKLDITCKDINDCDPEYIIAFHPLLENGKFSVDYDNASSVWIHHSSGSNFEEKCQTVADTYAAINRSNNTAAASLGSIACDALT